MVVEKEYIATAIIENEKTANVAVGKENKATMAMKIREANIVVVRIETMTTATIEKNMMGTNAIKEEKRMMDTDASRVKEKSNDVSQQKGQSLNLDYIYDNSPLSFETNVLRIKKDGVSRSFIRD